MESHHYCDQVNEDFAQCALYDGNTAEARLHGEYIISEKLYATLPADERPYWHPRAEVCTRNEQQSVQSCVGANERGGIVVIAATPLDGRRDGVGRARDPNHTVASAALRQVVQYRAAQLAACAVYAELHCDNFSIVTNKMVVLNMHGAGTRRKSEHQWS
jgi:hypothetical protein